MWADSHPQAQPSYSSCLGQDKQTVLSVMFAHQLPFVGSLRTSQDKARQELLSQKGTD